MKKYLIFINLLIVTNLSFAQSPDWLWATHAAGSHNDYGEEVATDSNGNIFVTGFFQSSTITFGSITLTNASLNNNPDVFVVKYDAAGNALWAKSIGGTAFEYSFGIATDAGGNVVVTGQFNS